jgi:hypothetical protein
MNTICHPGSPTWGDVQFEEELVKPFPESELRWTVAASSNKNTPRQMDLWTPYLNADSIRHRLDEVAGPGGWAVTYEAAGERTLICRLTIHGVTRADVGEPGDKARQPWKAAATDALKRAAVQFGIGRYLHKIPGEWRKPDTAPPQSRQSPPAAALPRDGQQRPARRRPAQPPASAVVAPEDPPPPPPSPPIPRERFEALMKAHGISWGKAATLLGAMVGDSPDAAINNYVDLLPGDPEQRWKTATDNLSRALADEALNSG